MVRAEEGRKLCQAKKGACRAFYLRSFEFKYQARNLERMLVVNYQLEHGRRPPGQDSGR